MMDAKYLIELHFVLGESTGFIEANGLHTSTLYRFFRLHAHNPTLTQPGQTERVKQVEEDRI